MFCWAFKALRRVPSLPALPVVVNESFVDDTTSQTGGEILRQSFQFAGTCHPYLPRRGLGKWELFEWVPCLNNSYLRPATASWWLSVPVLWADAKTSWHDEAWVRTVRWQNTCLDVQTHQLQSICLNVLNIFILFLCMFIKYLILKQYLYIYLNYIVIFSYII